MLSDNIQRDFVDKREQFSRLAAEFQQAYMPPDDDSQYRFLTMFQHLMALNSVLAQEPALAALRSAAEIGFAHAKVELKDIPATKGREDELREALVKMLEQERRRYHSTPEAQGFFRRNNAAALAAIGGMPK